MKPTIYMAAAVFACAASAGTQSIRDTAVQMATPSGVLHGSLMTPAGATEKVPVALIIAGSGPTDRDGNTPMLPGKNNSLKMIAEALGAEGVASLRVDKRGIAQSTAAGTTEDALRFDTYIDDAVAWIAWLRSSGRFSKYIVVGHSEGSLIGAMAARRASVDGFVSVAGAGRTAATVLEEQLRNNAPHLAPDGMRIISELAAGRRVADVPAPLAAAFRPSVQPYLISWLNLDPAAEVARLQIPVLIVQGTTDVQIRAEDARRISEKSPRATLALIDGMNHVLKEVRDASQQAAAYSDPSLPLHPELVKALATFMRQWTGRSPR